MGQREEFYKIFGGKAPPGFVYISDAECDRVAMVPKGDAEAWGALLNFDLRRKLREVNS